MRRARPPGVEQKSVDRVSRGALEDPPLLGGMDVGLLTGHKPCAERNALRPSRTARAMPTPSPMPPKASTGTGATAATAAGSSV